MPRQLMLDAWRHMSRFMRAFIFIHIDAAYCFAATLLLRALCRAAGADAYAAYAAAFRYALMLMMPLMRVILPLATPIFFAAISCQRDVTPLFFATLAIRHTLRRR